MTAPGGFTAASGSPYHASAPTRCRVALADVNGDGKLDLVVGQLHVAATCRVLLGNGDGTLRRRATSSVRRRRDRYRRGRRRQRRRQARPRVSPTASANNVTVLLGNGTGGFTAAPGSPFATGGTRTRRHRAGRRQRRRQARHRRRRTAADQQRDGAAGRRQRRLHRRVRQPVQRRAPAPYFVALADLNGDGKLDLVIAQQRVERQRHACCLGNGTGGFARRHAFSRRAHLQSLRRRGGRRQRRRQPRLSLTRQPAAATMSASCSGNGTGGFTAATGSPFGLGSAIRAALGGPGGVQERWQAGPRHGELLFRQRDGAPESMSAGARTDAALEGPRPQAALASDRRTHAPDPRIRRVRRFGAPTSPPSRAIKTSSASCSRSSRRGAPPASRSCCTRASSSPSSSIPHPATGSTETWTS